jgi:hypothetical protein
VVSYLQTTFDKEKFTLNSSFWWGLKIITSELIMLAVVILYLPGPIDQE